VHRQEMAASTRAVRPWTSGEENKLREMLDAGKTASEIAAELNRTRAAIYARLQRVYRMRPIRDYTKP
jgi:DNA-binding NarL/FixJ family response regulator